MKEPQESGPGLFHIIQQLAASENALWNILDGLKSNTTHASFFCREYWGSSGSQAQLSLEKLSCNERLKRQVQQACVLESLSLGVASHLCSGVMQGISVTIRSRLRNLLYYIHENCLVLLDMVCQRWMIENQSNWQEQPEKTGHCPENLNLDVLVRVKRYRRLRRGEHVMALRQHNEMIVNVVRQLCRGAAPKRPPLSSRGTHSPGGDRSPGGVRGTMSAPGGAPNVLSIVNDVLTARQPLDRLRASVIRSKMLQHMCFRPLLNIDGADPDCPWPREDPYNRYGADQFAHDGSLIWFEPLPPMLPNLEENPKLPPVGPDVYTLVLDLDETLVHYYELDGMGNYDIRPGMHEFLERMNQLGYEIVIFTAATQDYADWVIDQIDPGRLIHHRLYRQHALPWGPIFVKDMSKIGRDLDRCLIIDNVQENFMLQPHNGIFIVTWYDDPHDTALFALTPLLDELIVSRAKVSEILDKYRDQIPTWAGFDQFSQIGDGQYSDYGDYQDERPLEAPAEPQPPAAREQQMPPQQHHQLPPQQYQPQSVAPQKAPQQEYQQEYDMPIQQEERAAIPSPPVPAPAPAPFTSPDASAGAPRYTAAQPAASPYAGGYPQTSPAVTTYMTQRPMAGYPQPQMQAQAPAPQPEPQKPQQQYAQMPVHQGQPQLMQTQPQLMQPQMQMSAPRPQAAPAFAAGFGPCQAPMPQAAALGQGAPRPMFAGGFGPCQAPRPGAVVSQRR